MKYLIYSSFQSLHLQQIYTGFRMLSDNRLLNVKSVFHHPLQASISNDENQKFLLYVEVILNSGARRLMVFDTHDSYRIDPKILSHSDIYFKRSYYRKYIMEELPKKSEKIYPLGLNYPVYPYGRDWSSFVRIARDVRSTRGFRQLLSYIVRGRVGFLEESVHFHQRYPLKTSEMCALFFSLAYDPSLPGLPEKEAEDRYSRNEFREKCIRRLKSELGSRFYGGFVHTPFTRRNMADLLIPDPAFQRKDNFIRLLGNYPVCITTTGLLGSTGWKFAEYLAHSRAIVSEPIVFNVPGPLGTPDNFLSFSSPDECVACVDLLFSDPEAMHQMMVNNFLYFTQYVRPDMSLLNALITAERTGLLN
jgi:hypothetical protein